MYPSDIRKKLATGKPVLSTSMPSFEPHIANATYNCKPDWVWIDTEHNPWGTESMGTLCVDGRKKGVAPVIRIPWNDPAYIKKAYDVGAVGVMIPQVDTPDEVRQAIHDAKYPPIGERGIAPFFAGYLDGVSARDVVDNANDETLLILFLTLNFFLSIFVIFIISFYLLFLKYTDLALLCLYLCRVLVV